MSKTDRSFIASKSSSDNLSNHNKHLCFCCLQDKTWIKMPKWNIFLISSKVFVLITEIFWRTFWGNKWRSVFDVVKDSSLFVPETKHTKDLIIYCSFIIYYVLMIIKSIIWYISCASYNITVQWISFRQKKLINVLQTSE